MPRLFPSLLLAFFLATHAFAESATWLGERVGGTGDWGNFVNWLGPAPGIYPHQPGDVASLTFSVPANGVATINAPTTVGILNIGTTRGAIHYAIPNANGATLTLDNSGTGAQINQVATSAGDTIALPLVLNDNLTITNYSANMLSIGAGGHDAPVTSQGGPRNLTLAVDAGPGGGTGIFFVDNSGINISGTLTNAGSSDAAARIQGGIGSGVTAIVQASPSSPLVIASHIVANPAGTAFINSGGGPLIAEQGLSGTGNVILENNSSADENLHLGAAAIVGTVINAGTGIGNSELGGNIGPGVRNIVQSSATSGIDIRSGKLTIKDTFTLTNDGAAAINFLQGTDGSGNLIANCNNSGAINFNEALLDHAGLIINSGTGTGVAQFGPNSASLGPHITGIVEDSPTSALVFRDGNFNGGGFAGPVTVKSGTLQLVNGADLSRASGIIIGDTPDAGPRSFLSAAQMNNGGTLTPGSDQVLSGFGTIMDGNLSLSSGRTLMPGAKGTIGSLAVRSNLTLAGGANLNFTLGANGSSSRIAVGGQLIFADKNQVNLNVAPTTTGALTPGTYDLVTYSSLSGIAPHDIATSFHISGPNNFSYSLSATTAKISLTIAPRPR